MSNNKGEGKGEPEVIEFSDGSYGIRRNNQHALRGIEFLDIASANDGREYWWGLGDYNFTGNCKSHDLLKVRNIFLQQPYKRYSRELEAFKNASMAGDIGHVIELDIATAEYKLRGQHNAT